MEQLKGLIKTICSELIDNATKADAKSIDLKITNQEDYLLITATDDGQGIAPEKLRAVKALISSAQNANFSEESLAHSGFQMISLAAAKVEIESQENQGTIVKVYLNHYN